MLATGGSIDDTLKALREKGINCDAVISIVSAPEGIAKSNQKLIRSFQFYSWR